MLLILANGRDGELARHMRKGKEKTEAKENKSRN